MGKLGAMELILIVIALLFYFLPTFIAFIRDAPNKTRVFLLNLLLGWTLLGWIFALIRSFYTKNSPVVTKSPPATVVVNNTTYTTRPQESQASEQADREFAQKMANLRNLKDLYDSGALSREEFEREKEKMLR